MTGWALEMAGVQPGDAGLPSRLDLLNLALNRPRLAAFLASFAGDAAVRDLLLLDAMRPALALSSTGSVEDGTALALRPFRLWEYTWLFRALGFEAGTFDVLDVGGPASHVVVLAALCGNGVTSVDVNPAIVGAGRACAEALAIPHLSCRTADARRLEGFPDESVDRVICCSVLEHLRAEDQRLALLEMARVLRPGGIIGLTFDYGPPAPGLNPDLGPPHEPPQCAADLAARYVQRDLCVLGNTSLEEPVAGSLFAGEAGYTMGSLFLGRPPLAPVEAPVPAPGATSALSCLAAPEFPYLAFRCARRELERRHELLARLDLLERTSAERLRVLESVHREAAAIRVEAERREAALHETTHALRERNRLIAALMQDLD